MSTRRVESRKSRGNGAGVREEEERREVRTSVTSGNGRLWVS